MAKYLYCIQFESDPSCHKVLAGIENFSLNMISDCFMSELYRFEFSSVAKVQVHITDNLSLNNNMHSFIDVILIHKYLDVEKFLLFSVPEKREHIARLLYESVCYLGEFLQVSIDPFHDIFKKVIAKLRNFEGRIGKPCINKKINYVAQLYFSYQQHIEVGCCVKDSLNQHVLKLPLFHHLPVLESVLKMFGPLKLLDSGRLMIPRKNTNDFWCVDIPNKTTDFIFARAESRDPHGMYDLGMMYLKGYLVKEDKHKAIFWLRQASAAGYNRAHHKLLSLQDQFSSDIS